MRARPIIFAGAAAALAVGGFLLVALSPEAPSSSAAAGGEAAQPMARTVVGALGRVEPRSELIEVSAASVDRIEAICIGEGEYVQAGQVLARLEAHAERVAERDWLAARLEEARQLLAAETSLGGALIREAEFRLASIDEARPLEIEAQEATVRRLEVQLANERDILQNRRRLLAGEHETRRSADDQAAMVRQVEEELKAARAKLAELRTRLKIDRLMANNDLVTARASLTRAQVATSVASLEKELAMAQTRVDRASVRAPIDGQVLNILAKPGELSGNQPLLQMGDTSAMHVVAEVYETDIGYVQPGQRATVTSPALPKPLGGTVVQIGHLIFKNDVLDVDPAADADARVVEVRIELDEGEFAAKLSNLTVDVLISLDTGTAGPPRGGPHLGRDQAKAGVAAAAPRGCQHLERDQVKRDVVAAAPRRGWITSILETWGREVAPVLEEGQTAAP